MFGQKKGLTDTLTGSTKKAAKKAAKAEAEAEKKAAKAQGEAEKKAAKAAKKADRQAKADGKQDVQVAKHNAKAAKQNAKAVKNGPPPGLIGTLTDPKTAKRALAAAKVAGPALAPMALRASTALRGFLDERKSVQLGVPVDDVSSYRGPTGPALARLAGLEASVDDLRRRRSDLQVVRFADVSKSRLADLRTALRAAASMPAGRRRSTIVAVNRELGGIDADLMTFLVGRPV